MRNLCTRGSFPEGGYSIEIRANIKWHLCLCLTSRIRKFGNLKDVDCNPQKQSWKDIKEDKFAKILGTMETILTQLKSSFSRWVKFATRLLRMGFLSFKPLLVDRSSDNNRDKCENYTGIWPENAEKERSRYVSFDRLETVDGIWE